MGKSFLKLSADEIARNIALVQRAPLFERFFREGGMRIESLDRGLCVVSLPLSALMEEDTLHDKISFIVAEIVGYVASHAAAQTILERDDTRKISFCFNGTNTSRLPIFLMEKVLFCKASVLAHKRNGVDVTGEIYTAVRGPDVAKATCNYYFPFTEGTISEGTEEGELVAVRRALARENREQDES